MKTLTALIAALLVLPAGAQPVTLEELKASDVELDWKKLERGEIVWTGAGDREVNEAALVAVMAARFPATVAQVMEALGDPALQPGESHAIDDSSAESVRKSFEGFKGILDGHPDLDWFMSPKADGTFNASAAELAEVGQAVREAKQRESTQEEIVAALDGVVRKILAQRFQQYRERGNKGIAPYKLKRGDVHPGDYLSESMQPMELLRERAPDFYRAFLHYPEGGSENFEHRFFWSRQVDDKRPILSLKHWMVDVHESYALIGERQFYISHSLSTMNSFILLLQDGDSTVMLMINLSFTEIVRGFGSFVAHKVGRYKVANKIRPTFEALQAKLAR